MTGGKPGGLAGGPGGDPGGLADDRPSGLRNPAAAVRGVGAGTLVMEAVVLLLAIQPLRVLGGGLSGAGVAVAAGFAALHLALVPAVGRAWGWRAVLAAQAALVAAGLLHVALGVLGLLFGLVWWYLARVRRALLR